MNKADAVGFYTDIQQDHIGCCSLSFFFLFFSFFSLVSSGPIFGTEFLRLIQVASRPLVLTPK